MRRLYYWLFEVSVILAMFGCIALVLGFLSVETRAEAAQRGLATMPSSCKAAIYEGGHYLCWYTIRDHPLWFGLAVLALISLGLIQAKLLSYRVKHDV